MQRSSPLVRHHGRVRNASAALLGFGLSAWQRTGVLDPHGPVAGAERLILVNATAIMLVVVVPVIVLTLAFAWRYRATNRRASYWPEWSYSGQIELVVWSIPALTVVLLGGVAWSGSHLLDPAIAVKGASKTVHIEAVSLDWKWIFIYTDYRVAAVNELSVPSDAPIEFTLTSATVMNAFFIPQLGSQIYTMPGMSTHLNLLAAQAGDYPGFSSHFSGDGFSDMRFVVHALPAAEFAAWLEHTRSTGGALDTTAYQQLAAAGMPAAGTPAAARTYRSVDPALYDFIVGASTQPDIPAPGVPLSKRGN